MKTLVYLTAVVVILGACNAPVSKEERQNKVKALESEPFIDTVTFKINTEQALKLIDEYAAYSKDFPEDELAPEYLFRAAEICRSIKDPQRAVEFYKNIVENYNNYEKTPYCTFLIGFTYDNELHDMLKAKESYKKFIEKYPEHEFVKDAKILLENLGKSPEEIIKSFESASVEDTVVAS